MSRVLIKSTGWGVFQNDAGDARAVGLAPGITDLDGNGNQVYTNATGAGLATPTINADGEAAGWIEPGVYILTDPVDASTQQVEAPSGKDSAFAAEQATSLGANAALREELHFTGTWQVDIAAGTEVKIPVFIAPYQIRVTGAMIVTMGGVATADGSNFWSFRPRRYRPDGTFSDMLSSAGGNWTLVTPMAAGETRTLEGIEWGTNSVLEQGDTAVMRFASSGSPASILKAFAVTMRGEPL